MKSAKALGGRASIAFEAIRVDFIILTTLLS